MIVSVNSRPSLGDFELLMRNVDSILNEDASTRHSYYSKRNGSMLEDDVLLAMNEAAKGTAFEKTIEKVSGQRFPDIIAARYYGVEVKSTKEDHWTSTGSSILETTRVAGIERIFMTFGKLGGQPIQFLSKPYEMCLSGIAVTHMPRYLIDMRLKIGETIFDKMGIPYDELRNSDDPIASVSKYYTSKLKPGESLWWAKNPSDEAVSPTIRLWKNIPAEEKRRLSAQGCVLFPEVFGSNYDRYAVWLTSQGIVDPHIRDQFSAGGREQMHLSNGAVFSFPAVYRRVKNNKEYILHLLAGGDSFIENKSMWINSVLQWCSQVSSYSSVDYNISMDALQTVFWGANYDTVLHAWGDTLVAKQEPDKGLNKY